MPPAARPPFVHRRCARLVRLLAAGALVAAYTACAARQVVVRNSPRPDSEVFLSVSNRLAQAVNVYIVREATEGFLRQVRANSTEVIPLPDVVPGATAQFRARTVDGARTFNHGGAVLQGTMVWEIR